MKWTYKDCDVEITITFDTAVKSDLTPIVEIDCKDGRDLIILTTSQTFRTAESAELFGQDMARKWIDENLKTA